ncbi:MAG TPA: ankyrin repeat domain-containing protein [Tepidisphaeraceae bacterium]|jgi:ankyrin repeat protein|nr:ankyrin repeat domain-containing protein [Tepidisphaeraceae bacterium]
MNRRASPPTTAPPSGGGNSGFESLLRAILDDDRAGARKLIKGEARLSAGLVAKARLYESKIVHWLYANDTALHLAAAGHRAAIARMLLAAGADPNAARNHRQSRPLHYAADGYLQSPTFNASNQVKTIRCLLDAGADLHAADKNGATALHRAVRTRCAGAVECLLQAGADTTARNSSGATPFHLAAQNTGRGGSGAPAAKAAQRRIIESMLAQGVSPAIRDGQGKSVLDWATSEWVRQLLSVG